MSTPHPPAFSRRLHWMLAGLLLPFTVGAAPPGPLGTISDVRITGQGVDTPSDAPLCESFKPTPREVVAFFRHAVVITPRQEHDYFLHGPCYVEGTLRTRYGQWRWRLRNFGTAYVSVDGGEDAFLFADPRQESSLGDD
ncbi:hypothetical protein ACIPR8_09460 [Stenotrophomonas sp. LARHCG68]